jgi:phthalate 4,5-dioxygenase oxygenase subunit
VKIAVDCNWAQILEGAIDSAHSSTLHSTNMPAAGRKLALPSAG